MAFDPTKPVENSPLDAAEIRNQLNALQAQITALQSALDGKANMPSMGEFDPAISNPPTAADLEQFKDCLRDLLQQLMGVNW